MLLVAVELAVPVGTAERRSLVMKEQVCLRSYHYASGGSCCFARLWEALIVVIYCSQVVVDFNLKRRDGRHCLISRT